MLGISPDKPEKLAKFRERDGLTITLLSDPDKHVHDAYGAYGEKKLYGKTVQGVIRSTFVVDEEGKVVRRALQRQGHRSRRQAAQGPRSVGLARQDDGAIKESGDEQLDPGGPRPSHAGGGGTRGRAERAPGAPEHHHRRAGHPVESQEIVRREVESVKIRVAEATRTPDGQIRTELVAAVLGAVSLVLVGAGLLRRNRS